MPDYAGRVGYGTVGRNNVQTSGSIFQRLICVIDYVVALASANSSHWIQSFQAAD